MALEQVSNRGEAHLELNAFRRKHDCALVISGDSLEVLQHSAAHSDISMRSRWCWGRQPNRHWENKKYFSAKTNALEFNQGREDLGRKTNLQNILVISLWGRTIRTLSEGKQISVSTFTYGHNCPVTCVFCVSVSAPQLCLRYYEHEFVELACQCPAVVCCRCSPTQKAQIVTLLQQHTANRTCAIGECWQIMWQQALRARDGLLASVHKQPGKICQEESGWDGGGGGRLCSSTLRGGKY